MDLEQIISKMTLEDKIALCEGENFWETKAFKTYDIPSMFVCDGPNGLRKQDLKGGTDMLGVNRSQPATCFPAAVTTANSWDTALLQRVGNAIGEEARQQGVGVVLGPGCNMKRNPLCGRNFEYFSEDPYLSGKLAAGFIRGVEGQGVGTSLKHYAANSQELSRFTSDSIMDQRTLREIYLTGFEMAVKEGKPATVMCSYNKLGGIHASDHKELLTDILRTDWGFDGMVVTDWGAMNDRIEGFKAGCDLNMPGGSDYMIKECRKAVAEGRLSESDIDASVRRILRQVFRAAETGKVPYTCDYDDHRRIAREAAEQGAVLLKNERELLPLAENAKIAVIGALAKDMRYQGAGSSHVNPRKLDQPLDFLPGAVYAPGCDERGDTTEALLEEAVKAAQNADAAIVFAGLPARYESEGFDRDNMKMPEGHLRMIEAVAAANANTVVVLLCGSAVECPWADRVKSILYMGLPGEAGGEAIANLLYGRTNPSGKLAESWPYTYEDVPSSETFGKTQDALYVEGIYVGYRYYDKAEKAVRWPFGHGLSYTSFAYSDLSVENNTLRVTVANTGDRAGAEVVQLYVAAPQNGIHRPLRELKGFQKVLLEPGDSQILTFVLDDRSFAVWQDGWKVPGGTYGICVGDLSAEITVSGENVEIPQWQPGSWYATCKGKVTRAEWETMLGKVYTAPVLKKGSFTMDNTVMEMKDYSFVMKLMFKATELVVAKGTGGKVDYEDPEFRMMINAAAGGPLRSMQISGGIKGGVIPGMLEMANGHIWKGIVRMIKG
jgi:beta-glucosidase